MGGRGVYSIAHRLSKSLTSFGDNGGKAYPINLFGIKDKTLQGVENRIRKLKHEEAFIFDSDDKLVAGVSGGTTSVKPPYNWDDMKDATVTHGHPSDSFGFGGTLSMSDVNRMTHSEWKELRASAKGKGEYNYIVRKTNKADKYGLRKKIIKERDNIEQNLADIYKKSYNDAIANGKSKQSAKRIGAQVMSGYMHSYWKKVLPQYGYEYITRKKEYEYGR